MVKKSSVWYCLCFVLSKKETKISVSFLTEFPILKSKECQRI